MKKFSFVLPAFKREYLKKSINSILSQTFKDFELIIIDDASPEDLKSVIADCDDPRLKYFRNDKNIGGENLVRQWNHCLNYVSSDYTILASDDDIYHKDFLLKMDALISKYPNVDVFHSRVGIIDSDDRLIGITPTCAED